MNSEYNPTSLKKEDVDRKLAMLTDGGDLKFLDGISYKGLFVLPKLIRASMQKEDRIITENTPLVIPRFVKKSPLW